MAHIHFYSLVLLKKNFIGAEDHYKWQLDQFGNSLLIEDNTVSSLTFSEYAVRHGNNSPTTTLNWINGGELVSGSFVGDLAGSLLYKVDSCMQASDIDIYFKSKKDAMDFLAVNHSLIGISKDNENHPMCLYAYRGAVTYNLIWGVSYSTYKDLIGRFDIRACSWAFCPAKNKLYCLDGAEGDILDKKIVFNPTPRGVSVRRLVKYIEKGFAIDKYQRMFFVELLRSNLYSHDLEQATNDY